MAYQLRQAYRADLRVGTSITEGTANFLVNRRMNKSQQMRWSRQRCRSPASGSLRGIQWNARLRVGPPVSAACQTVGQRVMIPYSGHSRPIKITASDRSRSRRRCIRRGQMLRLCHCCRCTSPCNLIVRRKLPRARPSPGLPALGRDPPGRSLRAHRHIGTRSVIAQRADVYPHSGPGAYERAYPPAPWQVSGYSHYPPYGYYPRYSYYYYPADKPNGSQLTPGTSSCRNAETCRRD